MYDAVVVGGGIIGGAVALRLGQAGLTTLCIDAPHKPHGVASLAAGAMLGAFGEITADRRSAADEAELRFRIDAADMYPGWVAGLREATGHRLEVGLGTFVIANVAGINDRQNLAAIASELGRFDRPYSWVEPTEIPFLKPGRQHLAHQALFLPQEGFVDTQTLLAAVHVAMDAHPRVTVTQDLVTALAGDDARVLGVATVKGGQIDAGRVVLCAGVGVQKILDDSALAFAAKLPRIVAGKGVSFAVNAASRLEHVIRTPNRDFACGIHVVPRGNGQVYVGATNRIWSELPEADGITLGELHYLLDASVHEINTDLRTARIEQYFFGPRPLTADRVPLVGKTAVDNLFIGTGTYRNGVLMAPLVAEVLAREIVHSDVRSPNPFAVQGRLPVDGAGLRPQVIEEAMRDFVNFLQEPGGRLPYNRTQELEDFLRILALLALGEDDAGRVALRQEGQALLDRYPIAEIVPELFYRYHAAARAAAAATD